MYYRLFTNKYLLCCLVIFLILFIISEYYQSNESTTLEFFESQPEPIPNQNQKCPQKLFTDGIKYFLFNYHQAIDEVGTNPMIFESYEKYLTYHQENLSDECQVLKPISIRSRLEGKGKLPILPYHYMCKRRNAEAVAKHRDCVDKLYTRHTEEECKDFLKKNPRGDVFNNYNVEMCMVKDFQHDYPNTLNRNKIKKVTFSDPLIVESRN